MTWLFKIYEYINSKIKFDYTGYLFGQKIHIYPTKILHIFLHIFIGFTVSIFGIKSSLAMAITIFVYQLIWENLWQFKGSVKYTEAEIKERHSEILMNILDCIQYAIGALLFYLIF